MEICSTKGLFLGKSKYVLVRKDCVKFILMRFIHFKKYKAEYNEL